MIHDGALKKKTIYKYRAYSIEQREYDGSWVFMHYCPNGLQRRIWENNAIPLKNCDACEETIPEEIILLWGLIDKDPMSIKQAIVEKMMQVPDGLNCVQGEGKA